MLLFLRPWAYNVYGLTAEWEVRQQRITLGSCSSVYEAHSICREPQAKAVSFLKDQIARARRAKTSWFFLSEF